MHPFVDKTRSHVTAAIAGSVSCLFPLAICAAAETAAPAARTTAKPNIVVILADDLGYGDVRCFNPQHGKIATPNIDRLAAQGMMFTDAHSGSAVCTPTRYGLLTGSYAWRSWLKNWVVMEHMPLLIDPKTPTLQRTLQQTGYATGCIGKWHLGWGSDLNPDWNGDVKPGPLETGFDYFYGVPLSGNSSPKLQVFVENRRIVGLKEGDDTNNPATQKRLMRNCKDTGVILAGKAVDFIKRNKQKPFFLYLPTTNVHSPYTPHARFHSRLGAYADYVQELDWIVGQVTDTLDKEGLANNTLVIFSSDNGSDAKVSGLPQGHLTNGLLRGHKGQIHEGGHRVPFIARWPGKISPGSRSEATICLTDIYATTQAILGLPKPNNGALDSFDFSPLFNPKSAADFHRPPVVHHSVTGMFAIRDGDWKFIAGLGHGYTIDWPKCQVSGIGKPVKDRATGKFRDLTYTMPPFPKPKPGGPAGQLYNLKDDPKESNNLYLKHPEIVKRLSDQLNDIMHKKDRL